MPLLTVPEVSPDLVDRIRREAVNAMSLPNGGLEIAGVLFGTVQNGEVRITALRPWSERDEAKLEALLNDSRFDPELRRLDVLGWYVSHTRRTFELTAPDSAVFDRFFPGPMQLTAVIQPQPSGAAQFSWFVRAADGSLDPDRASYEFTAQAAPQQTREPEYITYGFLEPRPASARRQVRIGTRAFVSGMLLVVVAAIAVLLWLRAREPKIAPARVASTLPLRVSNVGTDLRIEFDASARVVQRATAGVLEIDDTVGKPVRIDLTPATLHYGHVIYSQPSHQVQIRLRLTQKDGGTADSIIYFVAPERDPPPAKADAPAKVDAPAKADARPKDSPGLTPPPASTVATPAVAPVAPAASSAIQTSEQVAVQVLPEIPAKARRTVHGKATVVVKVAVDESGEVTNATLEPGGSPYFGKLAVKAAQKWRFAGQSTGAEWFLRFEITQTDTRVTLKKSVVP